ncbi:MAG: hypothetical protein ACREF7_03755 [Candidatus Saccharimonadales bacterium]
MILENLTSLHKREEQIRADSLHLIEENESLSQHLAMIHGSMNVIYAFAHDHANATDDELTIQYIGLRLFNTAASSLKLSLSGYYQPGFALVRDIYETVELLDYMRSSPEQITVWRVSDKKQRIANFGAGVIHNKLNERDRLSINKRKEIYDLLSEYASHATSPGFQLLAPEGLGLIGPFLSKKYLKAWIEEAVKYVVYGATIFIDHFPKIEIPPLEAKAVFLNQSTIWREKYMTNTKLPNPDACLTPVHGYDRGSPKGIF